MKKLFLLIITVVLLSPIYLNCQTTSNPVQPAPAGEPEYNSIVHLFAGSGDDGIGGGLAWRTKYFGFQLTSIGGSANIPDYIEYEIPHGDYRLKDYITPSLSIDLLGSYPFDSAFSLTAGAGYFFKRAKTLAISNATGLAYEYDEKIIKQGLSGSFAVQVNHAWWSIGCGYHTLIGPVLQLGYVFR